MDALDKKLMGFHQIAQEKFQNILAMIPGKKCDLIIQPDLIKPLELVVGAAWLRSKGIDKIYKFDPNQLTVAQSSGHLLYFIRGHRLVTLSKVLDQIKGLRNRNASQYTDSAMTVYFHVIILPGVHCKHRKLLEEEGMHDIVQLYRFSWDFLTLDTNVLSLELPEVFREVFVARDYSVLPSIASALRIFDMITRKPNFVLTYGHQSGKVWQMVEHLERQRPSKNDENPNCNDVSVLLLMDRDKDFVSPFMTPVTYTGLLVEMFETNAGHLLTDRPNRIERGKLEWMEGAGKPAKSPQSPTSAPKTAAAATGSNLKMNSAVDKTFADNKYRHFSEVLTTLSVQAKALGLEGQEYSKDMKIHEMKQFVEKKLPKVAAAKRELVKHLNLCEEIVNEQLGKHFEMIQRVEENMAFGQNRKATLLEIEEVFLTLNMNRWVALKLLVLFHLTFEMTEDEMVTSFRNYFNAFGFENLTLIMQLIEAGLLSNSVLSLTSGRTASVLQQQKLKSKILGTLPKLQTAFQTNANKLKQIPADEAKSTADTPAAKKGQPNCPSYVFNRNYIPTIAQLTNILCTSQTFEEMFLKIGHLDQIRISSKLNPENLEPMSLSVMNNLIKSRKFPELLPFKPKSVMIFILGGVTYAEIAACDLIGKLTGCKVIVSSNCILSGYDILADLS